MPPKKNTSDTAAIADTSMAGTAAAQRRAAGLSDWLQKARQYPTEEAFAARFPLTYAAFKAWNGDDKPALRVVSKVDGFRRGGRTHATAPAMHNVMDLNFEQIEQILGEPLLIAELVEAPAEPDTDDVDDAAAAAADAKD